MNAGVLYDPKLRKVLVSHVQVDEALSVRHLVMVLCELFAAMCCEMEQETSE